MKAKLFIACLTLLLPAVAIGLNGVNDHTAMSCIAKDVDRAWSFLTFRNTCNAPLNVTFCQKSQVGELVRSLGMLEYGDWTCSNKYIYARGSVATIKWVHEESSIASHLLATSRYYLAACHTPYIPVFTEGTRFTCQPGGNFYAW